MGEKRSRRSSGRYQFRLGRDDLHIHTHRLHFSLDWAPTRTGSGLLYLVKLYKFHLISQPGHAPIS